MKDERRESDEDKQQDPTDGTGHAAGEADELSDRYEPPGGADTRLAEETAEGSAGISRAVGTQAA